MKPMEWMTIPDLQKTIDDSLFSELAWLPSQIMMRESLREEIYERRSSKRFDANGNLDGVSQGNRRVNNVRREEIARV